MEPDVTKLDLYLLLEISNEANEKEIKKAYRKKALTCHPDKHPDDPKAAQQFRQISKALEVLTDETAKAAYDRLLKARKNSQIRHRELDSKRRKLKDELEAREKAAKDDVVSEMDAAVLFAQEIERLRREGSRQLEEENEKLRIQIEEELRLMSQEGKASIHKLKVKCKSKKFQFDEENIRKYFVKHGIINLLVISKTSKSALIEYADSRSSFEAANDDSLMQLFKMSVMNANGKSEPRDIDKKNKSSNEVIIENKSEGISSSSSSTSSSTSYTNFNRVTPNMSHNDFESLVLRNMRIAAEREKLLRQIEEEDDKEKNNKEEIIIE